MANPNWVKGVSGNPKGRVPKARALTAILEKAGSATVDAGGDKKVARKRLIAAMAWEAVTTGYIKFPDGISRMIGVGDWIDIVKWIFAQIDGPPKIEQSIEVDATAEVRLILDA